MNNKSRIRNLLDKYLNNSCTENELKELLNILKRADNEPEIKRLLSDRWKQLSDTDISIEDHSIEQGNQWFEEIYTEVQKREKPVKNRVRIQADSKLAVGISRNQNSFQWIKVAAILLLSGLLSLVYYTFTQHTIHENSVAYTVKEAGPGEKVRFILSDGTQVHLNSESRLRYRDQFDGTMREVHLEGEGYFVVTHDTDRPFLVHTKEVTTKVLGTSFNVRSYSDDSAVVVAVAEGKVAVLESGAGMTEENYGAVLEANQWTNYTLSENSFDTQSGDVLALTSWKDDILYYKNEKLVQVAKELERWYGVQVILRDEAIKDCEIRGEHRSETLVNVLESITYAFVDMEYQINGRQIELTGSGCREM